MKKLAFALLLAASALRAFADTDVVDGITWAYSVWGVEAVLERAETSPSGTIRLPSSLGGCPVTSIGYGAFSGCSGLTSITIPDSVTSIGDLAFSGCSELMSVTIPDSVTSIGSGVFENCSEGLFDTNSIAGVVLVDGWAIGYTDSLSGDLDLTGIRGIAALAFESCSSVTSVTVPDGVTTIGYDMFSGCSALTSISIPDSVTFIGSGAFENCSEGLFDTNSIAGVVLVDGWVIGHTDSLSGHLDLTGTRGIAGGAFSDCSGLASITIPDSVKSIGGQTFHGCSGLTSITIPSSVTSIGPSAFSFCSGLTSITIPDSVTSIGDEAFSGCVELATASMGNGVTSIGNRAFEGCWNLTSIALSDNVTSVGDGAFSGLDNYQLEICVEITDPAKWSDGSLNRALAGARRLCRNGEEITTFSVPDGVTSIGDMAFFNCHWLTSVNIPASVTNIGFSVFDSYGLSRVNFSGNAPEAVDERAFLCDATIHVRQGSTGWGVDIPGTWNGRPIVYGLVYSASVSAAGNGGQVVGGGDYGEGETAAIRAVPAEGYVLACWTGDLADRAAEVELPMTRDWTATAVFIPESAADRLAVERAEKNGLYSESQIRAMTAGDLLLDVSEGEVRIGVCLQENDNLSDANGWHAVELGADAVDVGADGSVDIRVPADADVRFFRLVVP